MAISLSTQGTTAYRQRAIRRAALIRWPIMMTPWPPCRALPAHDGFGTGVRSAAWVTLVGGSRKPGADALPHAGHLRLSRSLANYCRGTRPSRPPQAEHYAQPRSEASNSKRGPTADAAGGANTRTS